MVLVCFGHNITIGVNVTSWRLPRTMISRISLVSWLLQWTFIDWMPARIQRKPALFFPSLWAHHCSIVLWATRINHHPLATSSGTNFQTPRHTFGISCLALAERQLWRRFQVSPKGEMKLPYVLSRRVGQEFATGLGPVAAGWGLGWVGPSRECEKCAETQWQLSETSSSACREKPQASFLVWFPLVSICKCCAWPKVTKPETWEEASDSWTVGLNMGSGRPDTWECCGISSQIWIPWPETWEDCQVSVYRNRPKSGWAAVWMDVLGFRHSPPATGISLEVRSEVSVVQSPPGSTTSMCLPEIHSDPLQHQNWGWGRWFSFQRLGCNSGSSYSERPLRQ